jgi:hypothetical protein
MKILFLLLSAIAWAEPCEPHVEMPYGRKDGVNRLFELQHEPAKISPYFKVTVNNREQIPGEDYTRNGKKIEFKEGKQPQVDSMFLVYYRSGDNCQ